MFEEPKEKNKFGDKIVIHKTSHRSSGISLFINKIHSVSGLYFFSSIMHIFLGSIVVALSLLGVIEVLWLATLTTIVGSISCLVGVSLLFNIFSRTAAFDTLVHKAINRVVQYQN